MADPAPSPPGSRPEAPYREVTPAAILFGILIGVVMNAAITYSGLKIGFTIGGSAIAAVLGWGVLRGILRKGTILENNIAQTVASSVNTSNSGVIFTLPVLFLLGIQLGLVWAIAATIHAALDPLIDGPAYAFIEGRDALQQSAGMSTYALVMDPFSRGERQLARAWSASVDGHAPEARASLKRAAPLLHAATDAFPAPDDRS